MAIGNRRLPKARMYQHNCTLRDAGRRKDDSTSAAKLTLSPGGLIGQTSLTADNVVERFFKVVEEDGHIDQAAIRSCVSEKGADPILARDSALATFLRVTGTPTLFIN